MPHFPQAFPDTRMRRLRQHEWVRSLVRENRLAPADLIWSMVVHDGAEARIPVPSMPGVFRLSPEAAAAEARRARALGIPALAIFPHIDPAKKDARGSEADNPDGLVARSIRAIKDAVPDVGVICDVALDPFTDHGHDGLLEGNVIPNDATVECLVAQALMQARAGADVIAPSDMMDGRVGAIRRALDQAGHENVMLLAYSAKYASGFYGPYRDAIGSAKALRGDKKTYQMDPANGDEGLREAALDLAEGADMIMVKPGLPYLDMVWRIKHAFGVPVVVFQVSGEYAMMKAAAANGWLDGPRVMMESLTCFRRAGADAIISYWAPEAAEILAGS